PRFVLSCLQSSSFGSPAPSIQSPRFSWFLLHIYTSVLFISGGNILDRRSHFMSCPFALAKPVLPACPCLFLPSPSKFCSLNHFTYRHAACSSAFWGPPPYQS
ncbi:hypothetical protein ATANTOWER_015192, partial [Ataeniobius toweri]|nr:hypothetical protein [Ataeniobius toweri]